MLEWHFAGVGLIMPIVAHPLAIWSALKLSTYKYQAHDQGIPMKEKVSLPRIWFYCVCEGDTVEAFYPHPPPSTIFHSQRRNSLPLGSFEYGNANPESCWMSIIFERHLANHFSPPSSSSGRFGTPSSHHCLINHNMLRTWSTNSG